MLDPREVGVALALDPAWADRCREAWTRLVATAVFGDLRASRVGAMPRLRKKVLDAGERLRSLLAPRDWIPQPREQLKNAMASWLAFEEALRLVSEALPELQGGDDLDAFRTRLAALDRLVRDEIEPRANAWAALLARRGEEDDNPPA